MTANSPFSRCRSASSPERASDDLSKVLEDARDGEQVALVVVDEKHARFLRPVARKSCSLARSCARRLPDPAFTCYSAASSGRPLPGSRGFARPSDPNPKQRQQQLDIDRLGDIVRGARIEALLAVTFHRFCGDRDQRKIGELRALSDLLHRLISVHVGHHDVDERDIDARCLLKNQDSVLSPLGVENLHIVAFKNARQREDVADVVVDDQHPGACELLDLPL